MSEPQNLPPFHAAKAQLSRCLSEQDVPSEITWICRDDVAEFWPRTYIRHCDHHDEAAARRRYEQGVARGLGVHLSVFCFHGDQALCYIWLPKDETDASYRMLVGLKLSFPVNDERRIIVKVRNRLLWAWLKWRERRSSRHSSADDIQQ